MYESIHIHERLNNVISILDHMTLTGFRQFDAISTVMKEVAAIDQEMLKAEQDAKEGKEDAENPAE